MIAFLSSLGIWKWFIAGGVLLALEIILPGAFMMWFGLAALLVGAISLLVDWTWQAQLVAFAAFSVAAFPLWRRVGRRVQPLSDQPFLNRRAEGYVGRIFTLEQPIVDSVGIVRIGDTVWRVRGPDHPAGGRVKVTGADAATLIVEPQA
jgi:membrane protein implicated in regulation of membrane protease activity